MSERFKIVLFAVLPAAAAASLTFFAVSRQNRLLLEDRDRRHQAEIARLRELSESAQAQVETLRRELESAGVPLPQSPVARAPKSADVEHLEAVRSLAAVQKQVTELSAANRDLQSRAVDLQSAVDKLSAENKKLSAETDDLRESMERTRRVVAATEAELKTKTDRLVQLEAALARTREENAGATAQIRSIAGLLRDFEELNRRRENTLTNLQRRYRELTDLYRSTLLTIEQQRDNPAIRQLPDASRIQSTVLAAEDDLRQIAALNTQAQRLTQRLQSTR